MIDLATLTGAIIIGLGHENAGVFSNNDAFCCDAFLKAARPRARARGACRWARPMTSSSNPHRRHEERRRPAAGSITAAQFLQRFVKDDTPWIHLDIAGVAA
jgi:leucyl aminopeptidase